MLATWSSKDGTSWEQLKSLSMPKTKRQVLIGTSNCSSVLPTNYKCS